MSWISSRRLDWTGAVDAHQESRVRPAQSDRTNASHERRVRADARTCAGPAGVRRRPFAIRLALGELADALILGGQRVLPARVQALGYEFLHETLEPALREIYGKRERRSFVLVLQSFVRSWSLVL